MIAMSDISKSKLHDKLLENWNSRSIFYNMPHLYNSLNISIDDILEANSRNRECLLRYSNYSKIKSSFYIQLFEQLMVESYNKNKSDTGEHFIVAKHVSKNRTNTDFIDSIYHDFYRDFIDYITVTARKYK